MPALISAYCGLARYFSNSAGPGRRVERREGAGDRAPFGDRQARVGQPGQPADQRSSRRRGRRAARARARSPGASRGGARAPPGPARPAPRRPPRRCCGVSCRSLPRLHDVGGVRRAGKRIVRRAPRARPPSPPGVSRSTSAASPAVGTSTTKSAAVGEDRARALVAGERRAASSKKRRPNSTGWPGRAVGADGADDLAPLAGVEGGDQPVDVGRADLRHVGEQHDHRVGALGDRGEPGAQRGGHALGPVRRLDGLDPEPGERRGPRRRVRRQHDDDRRRRGSRSAASATARSTGRPPTSSSSLSRPAHPPGRPGGEHQRGDPRRPGRPGAARRAAAAARRSPSAARRPPSPRCRRRSTASPAASRSSTQSAPFSAGERAQPGRPTTGRPACSPRKSRLPGSTGIPKRISRPPAATSAAGQVSAASEVAEAPRISTRSPSAAAIAAATAAVSCGTMTGGAIVLAERGEPRARPPPRPLATRLGFMPGRRGQDQRRAAPAGSGAAGSHRRRRWRAGATARASSLPATRVGDDLDGRHHLPGPHPRPVRQRREGDRRVAAVQRVDGAAIDPEHAVGRRRRG